MTHASIAACLTAMCMATASFAAAPALVPLTRPATRPTTGPTVVAAASRPGDESERAATELSDYLNAHTVELGPKLAQAKFNPDGGVDEYNKIKLLLPAEMAAKVDLAIPALKQRHVNSQIAVNLVFIGKGLTAYAARKDDTLPTGLGAIVKDVPSIETFLPPDSTIPDDVKSGTPDQQAPWINTHSMFAFPGAGLKLSGIAHPSATIIAHERLDLDRQKPRLAVLYADGHAEALDRSKLEELLKLK